MLTFEFLPCVLAGLKKVLKDGEKLPAIYSDPTFSQSNNWVLSTSQLTSEFFEGWGYGEGESQGGNEALNGTEKLMQQFDCQLWTRASVSLILSTTARCVSQSRR